MHLRKPGDLHAMRPSICPPLPHCPLPDFQESDLPKVSAVTGGAVFEPYLPPLSMIKKKKSDEWTQERMKESWQPNIDKWKTKVKKNPGMWIH